MQQLKQVCEFSGGTNKLLLSTAGADHLGICVHQAAAHIAVSAQGTTCSALMLPIASTMLTTPSSFHHSGEDSNGE